MTVYAVLASLIPILWATGIGSDVMKPIAAPMVGGMITSTVHVLIVVPVFFVLIKERALRRGALRIGEKAMRSRIDTYSAASPRPHSIDSFLDDDGNHDQRGEWVRPPESKSGVQEKPHQ
jgi:hypothetical protein